MPPIRARGTRLPRKRPRRIQAQRTEYGLDFGDKVVLDPGTRGRIPVCCIDHLDAGGAQRRQQHVVQTGVLLVHQALGALVYGRELLAQCEAVGADLG